MKKFIIVALCLSSSFLMGMERSPVDKLYDLMVDEAKSDEYILNEMKKTNGLTAASMDQYTNTLLNLAIMTKRKNLVQTMIEDNAFDITIKLRGDQRDDADGLLVTIVKEGWADAVQALIHKGVNVNVKDRSGMTPLHIAADKGFPEVVKQLLTAEGIKLNEQDSSGWTPLHWAVHHAFSWSEGELERRECAKLLIAAGADPDIKGVGNTKTPIELAEQYDDDKKFVIALKQEIEKFKTGKGGVLEQKLKSLKDKLVELQSKLSGLSAKLANLKNNLKK